jgi:hypothetical protein
MITSVVLRRKPAGSRDAESAGTGAHTGPGRAGQQCGWYAVQALQLAPVQLHEVQHSRRWTRSL